MLSLFTNEVSLSMLVLCLSIVSLVSKAPNDTPFSLFFDLSWLAFINGVADDCPVFCLSILSFVSIF